MLSLNINTVIKFMENIYCWESKFQICEYSNKLLSLIQSLNHRVENLVDVKQVKKACYYAKEYHGSQLRRSGEPYYSHPLEVGYLFAYYAGIEQPKYYTTDLIVTAILHDCLEDTALTRDMISKIFNENIACMVADLTRIKEETKITSADSIDLLLSNNKEGVLLIKIFDRLHNVRTINFMPPNKIAIILYETLKKFVFSSIYAGTTNIEQELIEICYQHFSRSWEGERGIAFNEEYRLPFLKQ